MPMLNDILNFLEISPNLGTSGQPTAAQFPAIQAAGYALVINLLPASSTSALPGEAGLVASLGMDYIAIPVIWDAPTSADLQQFFAALGANKGRKIYVHCAMNMRVSAFVFLYRVLVQKEDPETVKWSMYTIWEPNETWQTFIDAELKM
jgi:protein tyrosine phosphatase (PTP) superfamily phosphohydrolase (DUF442 family)